jgi:hypothetical protein
MPNFRVQFAQTVIQLFRQLIDANYDETDIVEIRDGWLVARRLFACRVMASGKIFLSHSIGAASVLVSIRARPALVVAGLLHNVYMNGRFSDGGRGASEARRAEIRAAVGPEAESVIFRFWSQKWNSDTLQAWLDLDELSDAQRDDLAVRLADAIDHSQGLGLVYSGALDNRQRFEKLRDPMVELARKHGFAELADIWLAESAANEDAAIPATISDGLPAKGYIATPHSYTGRLRGKWRRLRRRLGP